MPELYTKVTPQGPKPEYQLTVVTVCWNALADLKPTVESVLRQKAKGSISIEHVVVDGASTDGTPDWLAAQLAAGNIERYVSEPDCGIYDAMNKGINLARGRVLAWLNAGDWYEETEDLAECVLPICRGEAQSVAGWTYFPNHPFITYMKPDRDRMFFNTPCSHPSFFVSAELSRSLGGYDSQGLKCSADADFMYRIIRSTGFPVECRVHVANFLGGGVSSNCMDDFRDENVELLWRNWDMVEAKMERDPDFRRAIEACLAAHCKEFHGWQEKHGRAVPKQLKELQALCRKAARRAHSTYARFALRTLAAAYLPTLVKGRKTSALKRRLRDFCTHACYMDEGNRYREYLWCPKTPFWTHPLFTPLKKLLGR